MAQIVLDLKENGMNFANNIEHGLKRNTCLNIF